MTHSMTIFLMEIFSDMISFIAIGVIQNILLDKFPLYKIEWKTFWTVPIQFTLYVWWPGFDGTANKQKLLRFGFFVKKQTIRNNKQRYPPET